MTLNSKSYIKQQEESRTWPGFEPTNEGKQEDSSVLTTIPPRRTVGKSEFFSFYTMVQQNRSSVIMCTVSKLDKLYFA